MLHSSIFSSSMASLLLLHLIFSIFNSVNAQIQISLPSSVILPVNKEPSTLQYITQILYGVQLKPTNLLIDLSAPFVSINCDSSDKLISSCSIQCSIAKPFHFGDKKSCSFENPLSSCDLSVQSGITRLTTKGELAEDLIAVRSNSGTELTQIADFVFACASPNGLASGVEGILGLGKSPIGFASQIAAKFELNYKKYATCLSSFNGFISFGVMGTNPIVSSLTYTNLVNYTQGYFISLRSIKISGKRVASGGQKGKSVARISTVVPYTTMESTIYSVFKRAYLKAAKSMSLTRVTSVAPFELCFRSKGIEKTNFPAIDLVLQSEMVKWRMNSMVKLSDEVFCLGILDGGLDFDSKTSLVIGGFEMEDRLIEFDLGSNMLGFSLPLSMRQASCSDIVMESMVNELGSTKTGKHQI